MTDTTQLTDNNDRLNALNSLALLDTEPEERFDRITRLCQQVFDVSACLISLIDDSRQWIKSSQGVSIKEIPLDKSICKDSIASASPMVITDLSQHDNYCNSSLASAPVNARFYAAVPLKFHDQTIIGTLSILDTEPRQITPDKVALLEEFSNLIEAELEHIQVLDIESQLKTNEQALLIENERLALATHAGNIGVWDYNILTNELKWDDRMFELYGIRRDQFPGEYEAWSHALHPEDKARSEQELMDAIQGVKPFNTEFRVIWPSGAIHYIQAAGNIIRNRNGEAERMIGVNQDITRQKNMEQAIKQFQFIIQSSEDAIISKTPDGIISSWNPAAERMLGYKPEEVIGQSMLTLFPQDRIQEEQLVINRISAGDKVESYETIQRRKDGTLIDVSVTISPIFDEAGNVIGASKIMHDISERKRFDLMKNEFISTVSHELRTPLTSIKGALGLLIGKHSRNIPDKAFKMLEMANRNAERLSLLVDDILDLEKIQSGALRLDMKPVDIIQLAKKAYEENVGFSAKHDAELELVINTDSAVAMADEQRLMQVFANLISNAIKFSPYGEVVQIIVNCTESQIEVSIKDNGPGIPEDFKERIFTRFAQADSSDTKEKSGTGLGLSISKAIIDKHKGIIGYETSSQNGTRFYFQLPAQHTADETKPEKHKHIRKALICEDNESITDILKRILSEEGIRVDSAHLLNDARNLIDKNQYDLLILDLSLPDGNSIDLVDKLYQSEKSNKIPIIIVSAMADEGRNRYQGNSDMIIDWLQKPIDTDRLQKNLYLLQHPKAQILHVDDNLDMIQITALMFDDFSQFNYATTLNQATEMLSSQHFELIILDQTLPDGHGTELLSIIPEGTPIIIFSSSEYNGDDIRVKSTLNKSFANIKHLRSAALQALSQSLKELH